MFVKSMLASSLLVAVALTLTPSASAIDPLGCSESITRSDDTVKYEKQCIVTVYDGGYLVCVGYTESWTSDPGEFSTESDCKKGIVWEE